MITFRTRAALAAAVATGALALSATASMADVACNRYGECWRVASHYTNYPPRMGVRFYGDDWARTHHRHHHWRADRPDDRGYYSHGRWHAF
jgi:hypothetical protein